MERINMYIKDITDFDCFYVDVENGNFSLFTAPSGSIFIYDKETDEIEKIYEVYPDLYGQKFDIETKVPGKDKQRYFIREKSAYFPHFPGWEDAFFLKDYRIIHLYYNPDSNAGGAYIKNEIPFDLILESIKDSNYEDPFQMMESECKQYYIDIFTEEFEYYDKMFNEIQEDGVEFQAVSYFEETFDTLYNLLLDAYFYKWKEDNPQEVMKNSERDRIEEQVYLDILNYVKSRAGDIVINDKDFSIEKDGFKVKLDRRIYKFVEISYKIVCMNNDIRRLLL